MQVMVSQNINVERIEPARVLLYFISKSMIIDILLCGKVQEINTLLYVVTCICIHLFHASLIMYVYSHRTKDGAVYESEVKKRGAARRAYIKARSSGQTTGQIRQRYTNIFLRYSCISPLAHSLESGAPIILVPHHPNPLSR